MRFLLPLQVVQDARPPRAQAMGVGAAQALLVECCGVKAVLHNLQSR